MCAVDNIRLNDITLTLGGRALLEQFSLTLEAGKTTCLFGPSGCGKTTLLRLIAGLQKPDGGSVTGTAGLRTAVVFQEDRLLPWRTLLQNVALVCSEAEAKRRLEQVGLAADLAKYPGELSGGMKRRAALARALAFGGDLLLLDEPNSGVDDATSTELLSAVRTEYRGRTVVLITHDRTLGEQYSDRLVTLSGPPLCIAEQA